MWNLKNKILVFFIAMLFFTSVSAEELLHDHHEHHDHISVEIDCDFCVNAAPEFENEVLKEIAEAFGVEISTTPGEAPFSNGVVERGNTMLYVTMKKLKKIQNV